MEPILPVTFNARDLGGKRAAGGVVRSGVVVRSDAPVVLGDEGRGVLRRLGVRTAIDLREPVERELDPPDFDGLEIDVVRQPIIGGDFDVTTTMTLEDVYMRLLDARGRALTDAVRVLAQPGATPALLFCSAGKDRTGLLSALVLGAVGAPEEEIVADYHRTELNMKGPFRAAIEARAIAAGVSEQELAVKVGAPAELMGKVLEKLRREYGGAEGFLKAHGLTDDELDALRRRLVEPLASAA